MADMIQVTVNGESRQVEPSTTIAGLISLYRLTPEKVAVELNRRLVRSDKYQTALNSGDQVELVTFVGGG